MWDRKSIKGNAKSVLSRNYGVPFFVCLFVTLLSGDFSIGDFKGSVSIQVNQWETFQQPISISMGAIPFYLVSLGAFMILASILLKIFIIDPLKVGRARYFVKNIEEQAEIGEMFKVFREGHYLNIVKIMFLYDVKLFLWTLCFIVPGMVKGLEYTMVPYLLAEDGGMSTREVFGQTKAMTSGGKFDIFILYLSFFGWLLLGSLAFGIGVIFVHPYVEASFAELYYGLKQKEFS